MAVRVLVTGATGFVGTVLCDLLRESPYRVRAALRSSLRIPASVTESTIVGEIGSFTSWADSLRGIDLVVHLAARAHVLRDSLDNSKLYFETNSCGTERLAESAAAAGVRRFIYVSSVKVNGEGDRAPYTSESMPNPQDVYGESKWRAEKSLINISARTGMEAVIIRPPLVYGPGVRGNFLRLMSWAQKGAPIPLGAVRNSRSLVSVWNLCDLLLRALESPVAPGRVWMVSDGEDISTPQLAALLCTAMNKPVRLWPVPVAALKWGGVLMRRQMEIARLCESLTIDMTGTCRDLRWSPPLTLLQGIERTAQWYLETGI